MSKLKTKGVITQHEYKQAEEANKFSITDKLICSYCAQPVTLIIDRYANHYVNCTQHPYLKLTMTTPPVDPQPPYKQMHFSLSRLERNRSFSDNEKSAYIALEKGCPFCDRYMAANLRHLVSVRDVSLINQSFSCPDCGVSFTIIAIQRRLGDQDVIALRFQPKEAHMPWLKDRVVSIEPRPTHPTPQPQADRESRLPTQQQQTPSEEKHHSQSRLPQPPVRERILALWDNDFAEEISTGDIIAALTAAQPTHASTVKNQLKKAADAKQLHKVRHGYYRRLK